MKVLLLTRCGCSRLIDWSANDGRAPADIRIPMVAWDGAMLSVWRPIAAAAVPVEERVFEHTGEREGTSLIYRERGSR